ncbi:exodeoxyribonuclease I [Agaribacter flavus]|uniref:Exodeoxyribonuclease I n=1 Tax=Agaribacter flavus TaxID=1902781 RepID=A0ABV7FQS7_9ALTE
MQNIQGNNLDRNSILWHDYETWGVNPQLDFPAQFAAIRTDENLNIIGKPLNWFCQIPNDYLPHPEACLVTGITPQQTLRDGYIEAEFCQKVYAEMSLANTCNAGYNSIKFDDEVSRHMFYRNFYPVYSREYANGNSRWDVIDLVRAAYALRPEGIVWPEHEDGRPSFKLEDLTKANDIEHESAHDALSDVYATIAIAKLIKTHHPKLYDFYWQLRHKHKVLAQIDIANQKPFVHVSGFISARQGACTWMMPIAPHPTNKNAIICVDLSKPSDLLLENNEETLIAAMYDKTFTGERPGVHLVSVNKCPFVAPAKMLDEVNAERLGIQREKCLSNYKKLKESAFLPTLLVNVFSLDYRKDADKTRSNVDTLLYAREFPSPADNKWMEKVRNASPDELSLLYDEIESDLYKQQLFHYQGRNYPASLGFEFQNKWQMHRQQRIVSNNIENDNNMNAERFMQKLSELATLYADDHKKLRLLKSLELYVASL